MKQGKDLVIFLYEGDSEWCDIVEGYDAGFRPDRHTYETDNAAYSHVAGWCNEALRQDLHLVLLCDGDDNILGWFTDDVKALAAHAQGHLKGTN
jgi:hypothetical protein